MVATYLLERRRAILNGKLPENLATVVSILAPLLAMGSEAGEPLLLLLFPFGYACWQIWRFSSIWAELRDGGGLEELAGTGVSLARMADETAVYTLGRVIKTGSAPWLILAVYAGAEEWYLPLLLLGGLTAMVLSLSYTVQAWSSWSGLAWYWALFGVPFCFEALVFAVGLLSRMLTGGQTALMLLVGLAGLILLPRALTLKGLTSDRPSLAAMVRKNEGRRTAVPAGWWTGNPVFRRRLVRFSSRTARTLMLFASLPLALLSLVLADNALTNPYNGADQGLFKLLLGIAVLFFAATFIAYSDVRKERTTGSLDLMQTSALEPRELVDGWAMAAALLPGLVLMTSLPGVVLGSLSTGCANRAALAFVTGLVLLPAGAYFGVAVTEWDTERPWLPILLVGSGAVAFLMLVDLNHPSRANPAVLGALFVFAGGCLFWLRRMALAAYQG
ncbi:MAG: hypothetical protein AB7S38_41755 [Vulcanimicrobiota bacterium]